MTHPTGVHHLAISTADMKTQLKFFTEVMGMELQALYWMHGVEGAWHAFLKLNDHSSLTFVHLPAMLEARTERGVTHAAHAGDASAPGTMQHIAFGVETEDELLALRDRIRSHGVPVFGPIDHGMCKSMYFAGPEGLNLEVAVTEKPLIPAQWIDPEVVALAGIDADELAAMRKPADYVRPTRPVAQPAYDPQKPHLGYPEEAYRKMLAIPDDIYAARANFTEPPVPDAVA